MPMKARLEEEGGQHLVVTSSGPMTLPAAARQLAPIGAELVGEHDAGDHAHAEGDSEDLGPMEPADVAVDRLAGRAATQQPRAPTSQAASPMVKDGKRMWNEMVKANWMRDSNSGSSSGIPGLTAKLRALGLTDSLG